MSGQQRTAKIRPNLLDRIAPLAEDLLFAWPMACSALLLWLCFKWDMPWLTAWAWAGFAGGALHLVIMLLNQNHDPH